MVKIKKTRNHDLGAFYTPNQISEYIAEEIISLFSEDLNTESLNQITILDPTCGDGALLKSFENELNKKNVPINKKKHTFNKKKKVFGIDINPVACEESFNNVQEVLNNYRDHSYLVADAIKLMNPSLKNEGTIPSEINTLVEGNDIDCIIANPPWGASVSLSKEELEESGYSLASGQYDSYELIVELSLSLLKEGGYLGLILPDSIFFQQHKAFRELLLKETSIKLIYKLGEGFFPGVFRSTVLLIVKKEKLDTNLVRCLSLNQQQRLDVLSGDITLSEIDSPEFNGDTRKFIPQQRFMNDTEFRFDISISNNDLELTLINKIEKYPLAWEYFDSGRGIELSKNGLVEICTNCKKVTSVSKNSTPTCKFCGVEDTKIKSKIISKESQDTWSPVLAGEDVVRYNIPSSHYIDRSLEHFKYKESILTTGKPKLVVRKTGLGISASIDYENRLTLQTVFHFLPKDTAPEYLTPEYMLGVLNSRIMLFYHLKKNGETEWKSHPYLTQSGIKTFPIPLIDLSDFKKINIAISISNKVKEITTLPLHSPLFEELDLQIEFLVMKLYDINETEFQLVMETIRMAQQLKSISALKISSRINISQIFKGWEVNLLNKKEMGYASLYRK